MMHSPSTTGSRLAGRARGLLTAFGAASAAHLGSLLTGKGAVEQATKPALMPLLAAHAGAADGPTPGLLTGALLASAAGDVLLQVEDERAFLAGMGSFAAAHVCYIAMFAKQGALTDRRRTAIVAAGYGLAWLVMMHQLWPGLGGLRGPVAGYSLLLAATAVSSAGLGRRAGLGGGLFLLSDTLIATRLAKWKQLPGHEFWIMVTYLAAQYLLATAALKAAQED
ncbi:lysoplasmalogenase [Kitasatospora viridis]|uniref:Putative membrane protein YhhN n=1 Tax=Kitasatospora viridis TaxID=281105 RepID=A0A561UAT9_9ACTN|nr:lysoplasmalogenase [Kitasatospora viridis]TWF96476.1 putative membrane protein YhhN [Kitasatospora viridis]